MRREKDSVQTRQFLRKRGNAEIRESQISFILLRFPRTYTRTQLEAMSPEGVYDIFMGIPVVINPEDFRSHNTKRRGV